jgi:thioredoxin 1
MALVRSLQTNIQTEVASGLVGEANEESFEAEVERSPVPVLVDFWAPWCRPCRIVAPALDWIAARFAGRARVVRVNTDVNRRLAERFNIRGLPTVMVFCNGQVRNSAMGVRPPAEYVRYLERAVAR